MIADGAVRSAYLSIKEMSSNGACIRIKLSKALHYGCRAVGEGARSYLVRELLKAVRDSRGWAVPGLLKFSES